jgi:hypothetical protein
MLENSVAEVGINRIALAMTMQLHTIRRHVDNMPRRLNLGKERYGYYCICGGHG